jgi:hypothetical protein
MLVHEFFQGVRSSKRAMNQNRQSWIFEFLNLRGSFAEDLLYIVLPRKNTRNKPINFLTKKKETMIFKDDVVWWNPGVWNFHIYVKQFLEHIPFDFLNANVPVKENGKQKFLLNKHNFIENKRSGEVHLH